MPHPTHTDSQIRKNRIICPWILFILSLPMPSFAQAKSPIIEKKDTLHQKGDRSFQVGLQIGSENYYLHHQHLPYKLNSHSSLFALEISAEYPLVNWLSIYSAIGWERLSIDQGYYFIETWDNAPLNLHWFIQKYDIDFPTDPILEIDYKIKQYYDYLTLPIGLRFFNSPIDKRTRIWAGLEFRQFLHTSSRLRYRLRLDAERERGIGIEDAVSTAFYGRAYRFMLGIDRQIQSSLRLRISGHFTRSNTIGTGTRREMLNRYGISLSLLWPRRRDRKISNYSPSLFSY